MRFIHDILWLHFLLDYTHSVLNYNFHSTWQMCPLFDLEFNLSTEALSVWNLSLDSLLRSMNSTNLQFNISSESALQVDRNSNYEPIYHPVDYTGLDASVLSNHGYASPGHHQNALVSSFNLSSGIEPTYPPSVFTGVSGDSPFTAFATNLIAIPNGDSKSSS